MPMLCLWRANIESSLANIEGTTKHMAAMERWMVVVPVMMGLSFSSPKFTPLTKRLNPRMSRILPIIEPIKEYFTISISIKPLLMARIAITSPAASPKVALIMLERCSPVFSEITSVLPLPESGLAAPERLQLK
ncbi:MAG: hypothetical protein UZ01_02061 [Candidatus Brocadia sinica]|uniref:hypothetical protein n=1 Tax=Candidatus Brocadia sp. AMX2 TaxID=2293635 RepID=UPI0007951F87|nr:MULTISPECIES: hypothetical protein [Brocadia]KXK29685.1 MAG: hypothetical protein UZ01_02061 [Candidatus Brocadia sinica]MCK6466761.1 hypothetical protein [Candidatus Brocadia sinica]